MDLTLALVLTAGGAVAAAGLITGLIGMLKMLPRVGALLDGGREAIFAFVASAVLVAIAFVTYGPWTPEGGFLAFLAWYGVARLSMGIHDDVKARSIGGG